MTPLDFDAAYDDIGAGSHLETKNAKPAAPAIHTDPSSVALTRSLEAQNAALEKLLDRIEAKAAGTEPAKEVARTDIHARKQRTFEEFKAAAEERLDEIRRKGSADPLTEEKTDRLSAAVGDAEGQELARLRRENAQLRLKASRPSGPTGGRKGGTFSERSAVHALQRKAAIHYLKTGETTFQGHSLRDLEQKTLQSVINTDGGYFVHPEENQGPIERYLSESVDMRSLATVRPISAASYKTAFNLGGAGGGWVGETETRPETNTPQLAEFEFPAMELYAMPAATQNIIEDASTDIEQWISDEVGIKFSELDGAAFIAGDGNRKPHGILSPGYDFVANASWAHKKIGYIVTGVSGDLHATTPYDNILDLTGSLKKGYRANAQFLASRMSLNKVRKIKDTTGQYIWQPAARDGTPASLDGYPYTEVEEMPAFAANSYPLAFGDFKRGYLIVDRIGISVLRDPYSAKPYVLFYTRKRVGGGVQNFEAYKVLKAGTS